MSFRRTMPPPVKSTRVFDGKRYALFTRGETKTFARRFAKKHREAGFNIRIVPTTVWTPVRGGFRSSKAWSIYGRSEAIERRTLSVKGKRKKRFVSKTGVLRGRRR